MNSRATLPATLLFLFLVAYPAARIIARADLAAGPPADLLPIALFAVKQAGASLAAALVVGVPLGVFYAGGWGRALRGLLVASFSLPALLVIGMVGALFRGTELRFGFFAVVFAHAFLNAPWIALATAEGIRALPPAWIEAARTLGATRRRAFVRIGLPMLFRRVALAAAQVFALALTSFAIVLVLGGGPPIVTLETEIYAAVRGGGLVLGRASWFALAQLVLATAPLLVVATRGFGVGSRETLNAACARKRADSPRKRKVALGIAAAWLLLPGILFARFVSAERLVGLAGDAELRGALRLSLAIGAAAAGLSLAIGAVFAYGARGSRFVRALAAVPIGLSPLLISLGFFLAYSDFVDPFEGSVPGMVLVQTALFLPYALRFFLPLIEEGETGARRDLRRAARTLGATAFAAWRTLEWPRWRAAGIRLGALVFVWSFSELAAASFFGSERLTTVGVLLVRWFAQYRFDDVNAVLFGIYLFSSGVLVAVGMGKGDEG